VLLDVLDAHKEVLPFLLSVPVPDHVEELVDGRLHDGLLELLLPRPHLPQEVRHLLREARLLVIELGELGDAVDFFFLELLWRNSEELVDPELDLLLLVHDGRVMNDLVDLQLSLLIPQSRRPNMIDLFKAELALSDQQLDHLGAPLDQLDVVVLPKDLRKELLLLQLLDDFFSGERPSHMVVGAFDLLDDFFDALDPLVELLRVEEGEADLELQLGHQVLEVVHRVVPLEQVLIRPLH